MNEARKQKIADLRHKLSAMTPEERQQLAARGIVTTIEGHPLSFHNTIQ